MKENSRLKPRVQIVDKRHLNEPIQMPFVEFLLVRAKFRPILCNLLRHFWTLPGPTGHLLQVHGSKSKHRLHGQFF